MRHENWRVSTGQTFVKIIENTSVREEPMKGIVALIYSCVKKEMFSVLLTLPIQLVVTVWQ